LWERQNVAGKCHYNRHCAAVLGHRSRPNNKYTHTNKQAGMRAHLMYCYLLFIYIFTKLRLTLVQVNPIVYVMTLTGNLVRYNKVNYFIEVLTFSRLTDRTFYMQFHTLQLIYKLLSWDMRGALRTCERHIRCWSRIR